MVNYHPNLPARPRQKNKERAAFWLATAHGLASLGYCKLVRGLADEGLRAAVA